MSSLIQVANLNCSIIGEMAKITKLIPANIYVSTVYAQA